jgi:ATP-dependent DNA helicase DinG
MSLLSYFPDNQTPRGSQIKLLKGIESAFASGKKFVIVYAPTGSGKSFIAKTISNSSRDITDFVVDEVNSGDAFSMQYRPTEPIPEAYKKYMQSDMGGSFVLTITKNLQQQYKLLFEDSKLLKGKNNYKCNVDTTRTVDKAPCIGNTNLKRRCEYNMLCTYYNARNNSIINKFSVLNYKKFSTLPRHIRRRQFIICDEASELPNELVSIYSRTIPLNLLNQLGFIASKIPYENPPKFLGWLNEFSNVLSDEIATIERKYNSKTITENMSKILSNYRNTLNDIEATISLWDETEYIVELNRLHLKITPLKIDKLSKTIFNYGEKIVLMSGTIIDHQRFAKSLGIDDYEYIEVDSEFDPKKAPIYTVNSNRSLNRSNLPRMLPVLAKEIQSICNRHKGEKGVIHTHTNDITRYLYDALRGDRFLFRMDENENDVILKKHSESELPTVLVSPSLSYGVDLKGDLAKFQIIVKAAFLPLNDIRVSRLFKEDKQWYINEMLNTLIQACGRGVRSKDDECVTYILDGNITNNVIQNKSILPKYFIERFV